MGTSFGKVFERKFFESVKEAKNGEIFIYRIKDTDSTYNPTETSKFTTSNVCDFFVLWNGVLRALELKSTTYKSISFETDLSVPQTKMIKAHQIKDLNKLSQYKDITSGFLFNFRDEENMTEKVFYMSIQNFNEFAYNTDKKSINATDIVLYGGFPIKAVKRRKWFTYDIERLLEVTEKKGE